MKKLLVILCAGVFFFNSILPGMPVSAQTIYQPEHQAEADALCRLGIFNGTAQGFELERMPNRAEGAVMLVRLLGKESYALEADLAHPFRDVPDWASPYIGYLYREGLTNGTGKYSFSPQLLLSAEQYMSFMLRVLGYSEAEGDFSWNHSIYQAWELGIISSSDYQELFNLQKFRRDHMVWLSCLTLQARIKGQDCTLLEKLVEERVVPSVQADSSGLYFLGSRLPPQLISSAGVYSARNVWQLQLVLENALLNMEPSIKIYINDYQGKLKDDFAAAMEAAQAQVESITGISPACKNWRYSGDGIELHVILEYIHSDKQYLTLMKKVKEIAEDLIIPGMSDYDKEKALHDYIINNAEYDYDNFLKGTIPASSYTAYGVLILGRGVCQGYAEAMHLLCREAGLESLIVKGSSIYKGKWYDHAWNMLKLEGQYYHVDVCWDDVIATEGHGIRSYSYFNLNDQDMSQDHSWNRQQYPVCNAGSYNYYFYNNLLVQDYQAFKTRLNSLLSNGNSELTLKVADFRRSEYGDLSALMFSNGKVRSYKYIIDEGLGIITVYDIYYN
jgi:hypothetical protein